ncbi:MAG: translation elongation factor Ts [Prevotellaceae bacterium]|nr:translation elongation factor Ts [Prevotellaceae bacterium]MDY3855667.1 translation elongation factor Ts [Bacteroidaceae bacterium]
MAVNIADIQKLRKITGAGLADCKKALEEAAGDISAATEIVRAKGLAIAAKRSDRQAGEGCVLAKTDGKFGAMIALKCETDFVATNADFVKLTQDILDAAFAAKAKTLDEVKALKLGDITIAEAVTQRSGITGEKMELDGYLTIEGENVSVYNHQNKNVLCTMVALNEQADPEIGHQIAMQVAAMNPIAISEADVPQDVKDNELKVAIDKTKEEQVKRAVEGALRKAGFNLYISESEEHLAEGIQKHEITEAQADEIRQLKAKTAADKAAHMPEQMVQNIAKGRMAKFYKESCLLDQEYCMDATKTISQILQSASKTLTVNAYKRFTLRAE